MTLGLALLSSLAMARDFSAEEIVGTYKSQDNKATVTVNKILIAQPTLFEPARYEYKTDITVDAGPCLEMYGGDSVVSFLNNNLYYNGSWKPVEYLSARTRDDSDYDGDTFVSDVDFVATKKTADSGKVTYDFSLSIDVAHNPDYGDGADGGEAEFERCYAQTTTSWNLYKVK